MLIIVVPKLHRTYWSRHLTNTQGCSCILLPSRELTGHWNKQTTEGVLRHLYTVISIRVGPAVGEKLYWGLGAQTDTHDKRERLVLRKSKGCH